MGTVQSTAIVEASGLVASRQHADVLWTHNDNGDSRLFAMSSQGRHLGTYSTGLTVRDWEDIAIGPGPQAGINYLYIADTGDNSQVRTSVAVHRIAEPTATSTQAPVNLTLTGAATITLRYPDGPHDAETLIVDPATGDLYIVTKRDARSRIYRAAYPQSTTTTTTLMYLGDLTWGGAIGGDISPDGDEIIVKDFDTAFYYPRAAGTTIAAALMAAPAMIPYTTQQLGEGLTWDGQGRGYFANSEGTNQPLYYYERVTDAPGTVEFAAIGDYGANTTAERDVANLVKSWDPSFVVTLGDNNYSTGAASTIDTNIGQYYESFIGNYAGSYGPGSVTSRFFPALGNHDWDTPGATPYLNYFTLPGNERYYDFVRGPVHIFVVDSDAREPDGISSTSVQAQWLQSRLAASTAPFQVVLVHHAPYSSSATHGSNPTLQWPYRAWGADLVLSGHDHTYERIDVGGLTYLVNGLGGRSIYNFAAPVAGSQLRYNANYGALRVTATSQQLTTEFYSIDGGGTLIDRHTISATAPPPPPAGTLIPTGAIWKYSDTGVDLGTAWRGLTFNDSGWASGPAQLGYGDGDEATVVSYGPSANNKRITTYFRHAFTVANPSQYVSLSLSLLRDDGAIVYLNGQEVVRTNMPSGAVTYSTRASTNINPGPESVFLNFSIPATALVTGTNVLAVEIHQSSPKSADLSFNAGLTATATSSTPTTLVASGSTWRYLDTGVNLATAWRASGYNGSAWPTGAAQLGYGDGGEATVVGFGPNANQKYVTTYFRRTFNVSNRCAYSGLTLQLLRDDGAVVYLNGQEIARSNMPSGTISHTTLASTAIGGAAESTFYSFNVSPALLANGTNTLAVEIHQANRTSTDVSFDLRLTGTLAAGSASAPAALLAAWPNPIVVAPVATGNATAPIKRAPLLSVVHDDGLSVLTARRVLAAGRQRQVTLAAIDRVFDDLPTATPTPVD
jgi:hypothetical protein